MNKKWYLWRSIHRNQVFGQVSQASKEIRINVRDRDKVDRDVGCYSNGILNVKALSEIYQRNHD